MTAKKPPPVLVFLKTFASALIGLLILWFIIYGKDKAIVWLAPYLEKIPRNQSALGKLTDQVLGSATAKVKDKVARDQLLQSGTATFEQSPLTAPAREMRDDFETRVNEAVDSLKSLPAKEVATIKHELCNSWFPATPSAAATP